jgi:predicted ATPase
LAEKDLRSAVKGLRGEPHELFRKATPHDARDRIHLAVEVLLNPSGRDPWGASVKLNHTRIRYEVTIERRMDPKGIERLVVSEEWAKPIFATKDDWRPKGLNPSEEFKQQFMKYKRRSPWLSTNLEQDQHKFEIHQDGKAGRTLSAQAAEATVLSSITSAEFPHLFALREEMRSWRFLHLDPSSLRRPSPTTAPEILEPDGSNLATVLARILAETKSEENPKGALADIVADLSALIPGVLEVSIDEDEKNREYRIDISMREEIPFSSRVVSDGTLRILALLTMLHDPKHHGLICFEEPENGVHPSRLKMLMERLRNLVSQLWKEEADSERSLSQMILNSHSPVALSGLDRGEMLFSDLVSESDPIRKCITRKTRILPVEPGDQGSLLEKEKNYVTRFEVNQYLSTVASSKF